MNYMFKKLSAFEIERVCYRSAVYVNTEKMDILIRLICGIGIGLCAPLCAIAYFVSNGSSVSFYMFLAATLLSASGLIGSVFWRRSHDVFDKVLRSVGVEVSFKDIQNMSSEELEDFVRTHKSFHSWQKVSSSQIQETDTRVKECSCPDTQKEWDDMLNQVKTLKGFYVRQYMLDHINLQIKRHTTHKKEDQVQAVVSLLALREEEIEIDEGVVSHEKGPPTLSASKV